MRTLKGPKDPEVGAILAEMSNIKVWLDDLDGAETAARAAVEIYQAVPTDYPDRVMAEYYLADLLLNRGRIEDAAPLFERCWPLSVASTAKRVAQRRKRWHLSLRCVLRRRTLLQRRS